MVTGYRAKEPKQFLKTVEWFSDKNCTKKKEPERLTLPGAIKTALVTIWVLLLMGIPVLAQQRDLFVYNFADYFAEDTISNFIQRSGINTRLDYFDTNEMAEARLIAGKSGYDVVFVNSPGASRLIPAGALQKLDKSKLKNYANLDPAYLAMVRAFDPGNEYMIPYMITTTGIAYNTQAVAQRMGDAPVDSLDMFFKPEITEKFADCGIGIIDAPTEIIPIALNYSGLPPYSTDRQDLAKAKVLLDGLRPHIRHMRTSQMIDDMAAGELCLAFMWNGDANIAAARAREAGLDFDIIYRLPKEGTLVSFDNMAIPLDASNPQEAHEFIDYLLEPQVIADISNEVYYPNPNKEATPLVDEVMRSNPNLYPDAQMQHMLFVEQVLSPQEAQARTKIWTEFRAGN